MMKPHYYVISTESKEKVSAIMRPANFSDFRLTVENHWQTSWLSAYINDPALEKYAIEIEEGHEIIGLGAYRDVPNGIIVAVEYIESEPKSNPTITNERIYSGIGAALVAYGVQLSIEKGYEGAVYLKAKTSELREHYIKDFGAVPFSHADPFLLLIDGDAAYNLWSQYLEEE